MERPEQHQIDEAAQRVFRNSLPVEWVVREQTPDYGNDYLVEIAESGKLTGLSFAVQLKGKRNVRVSGGTVSFRMESRHLTYYVDRCRQPVFLVVVDTERSEGYWLFLQRHVLEDLGNTDWRCQATVSVRIPAIQTLRNVEALRRAAVEADKYMAGLRPGAVSAAITGERRRLESLDPRFHVVVRAAEAGCSYEMQAREPVEFSITFKGAPDKARQMIDDLVGRGLPVRLDPGDVEVRGSALLAKAFERSLTLQQQIDIDAAIRVAAIGPDGSEEGSLDHVPAKLEGGVRELRVTAHLPRTPLRLRATLRPLDEGPPPPVSFSFPVREWGGQRLLQLAYFDQLAQLFDAFRRGCGLRIECLVDGNRIFSATSPSDHLKSLRGTASFLSVVRKAREVAAWGGVNPVFPSEFTKELVDEIEDAHWAVVPGGDRRTANGVKISTQSSRSDLKKLFDEQPGDFSDGYLRLERGDEPMRFMGEKIPAKGLVFELTHARLDVPVDALRQRVREGSDFEISLRWVGTESSEWIVRRADT